MSSVSSFSCAEERYALLYLSTSHDGNNIQLTSDENSDTPSFFTHFRRLWTGPFEIFHF